MARLNEAINKKPLVVEAFVLNSSVFQKTETDILCIPLLDNKNHPTELKTVSKYKFISSGIKYLKSESILLQKQIDEIEEIYEKISAIRIKPRFTQILQKNSDYYFFKDFSRTTSDQNLSNFNYLDVPVERSFSYLKIFLSDSRRLIKSENYFVYLYLRIPK